MKLKAKKHTHIMIETDWEGIEGIMKCLEYVVRLNPITLKDNRNLLKKMLKKLKEDMHGYKAFLCEFKIKLNNIECEGLISCLFYLIENYTKSIGLTEFELKEIYHELRKSDGKLRWRIY